jgi:hypothetical protein
VICLGRRRPCALRNVDGFLVEDRMAFVITQGLVRRAVRRGAPVAARRLVRRSSDARRVAALGRSSS